MILQFTDAQYRDLAASLGMPDDSLEQAGVDLRRIHRLLTADKVNLDKLLPWEREYARAFDGLALTSIKQLDQNGYGVLELEAFEVDEVPARPQSDTPRAEVARRVRAKHAESYPELGHFFYRQIQEAFAEAWHMERVALMRERGISDDSFRPTAEAIVDARLAREKAERAARIEQMRAAAIERGEEFQEPVTPDWARPNRDAFVAQEIDRLSEEWFLGRLEIAASA